MFKEMPKQKREFLALANKTSVYMLRRAIETGGYVTPEGVLSKDQGDWMVDNGYFTRDSIHPNILIWTSQEAFDKYQAGTIRFVKFNRADGSFKIMNPADVIHTLVKRSETPIIAPQGLDLSKVITTDVKLEIEAIEPSKEERNVAGFIYRHFDKYLHNYRPTWNNKNKKSWKNNSQKVSAKNVDNSREVETVLTF